MNIFKISSKIISKNKRNKIRYIAFVALLFFPGYIFSQIGINNTAPKVTLHVDPTSTSDNTAEGIIAPILTKEQLIAKNNNYTSEQKGAIVYITDTNYASDAKTGEIIEEGYYFFNGDQWKSFSRISETAWRLQGSGNNPASASDNIYQTGTVSVGTDTATPDNVQFQVSGNEYVSGKLKVGSTVGYTTSAQLELSDNDKGILINKVSLQGRGIKAPVTDVVEGIMVYNISTVTTEGIVPGFYYWDGIQWLMLNFRSPQRSDNNVRNLQIDCKSAAGNANTSDKGTIMDFGDIVIGEDGSYGFTFRLYGPVTGTPTSGKAGFYYLALVVDDVIIDSVELDLVFPSPTTATSPLVLSSTTSLMGVIKAGQKVEFRLTNHTSSPFPWTLQAKPDGGAKTANRTSMLWWKLS